MKASNPNLLLSKELREKVEKKLADCCAIAKAKYPNLEFPMPTIRWDVKNHFGGYAIYSEWTVRFNLILCVENEEKFLATTVPHEMAHLIADRVYKQGPASARVNKMKAHGQEWKDAMILLNTPVKRTHTYDCASIQKVPRRARGSKLKGAEADFLLGRLFVASKRFPKKHLALFIEALQQLQEDQAKL